MKRPDPIDYTSVSKWTTALIESKPSMTVIDFDKDCRRHGVQAGRTQYYKAVRAYRAKHGLGRLPRGGKNNPRPADYTDRKPTRRKVGKTPDGRLIVDAPGRLEISRADPVADKAPVPIDEHTGPFNREARSTPHPARSWTHTKEVSEHIVKLLLWMSKYNVRVVTVESESQEVTLSNEPSLSRQLVPSPHFTIGGG